MGYNIIMNTIQQEISDAVMYNKDMAPLKELYTSQLEKLSVFFDKYLERYSSKLDTKDKNSPEWILYNKKLKEYSDYELGIRTIDYWTAKKALSKC